MLLKADIELDYFFGIAPLTKISGLDLAQFWPA
jgi:hypothetical protein